MNAATTMAAGLVTGAALSHPARPALRFTLDGDAGLEAHLAQVCALVRSGIKGLLGRDRLEGILLGGGYGRGEGGVLHTPDGDRPYNDMEFYVVLRGPAPWNELRFARPLAGLAHELSAAAGIEVEFKILSRRALRRQPVTMFSYDLVAGHRWVCGHEELLQGCAHHERAEAIPLAEATRLLMNRCTGLLYARERLARPDFSAEDADFAARNIAKAKLAVGDVVLAAFGQYHWSCRERARRLAARPDTQRLPGLAAIRTAHAAGLDFKLHPRRVAATAEELRADLGGIAQLAARVWLWLESRRLGPAFQTPLEYAFHPAEKCPETDPRWNALVNLRRFGASALRQGGLFRYPRERMLRALPVLLWHPAAVEEKPVRLRLGRILRTSAGTVPEFVDAYRRLWEIFR